MPEQKVGELLDSLGVTIDLADGDMVSDAIVIAKTITAEGEVGLVITKSEATSWIDELGLMAAAQQIMQCGSGFEQRET
jgi:hypothetical protein